MRLVRVAAGTRGARVRHSAAFATGPAGGYTPGDLAKAYGLDVNAAASNGLVVAIVDAFNNPNIRPDLNQFDSHYGLPAETATSFRVVNQTGGTSLPANDTGWGGEEALDVQTVRGLCHKCKIVLVEGTSASFGDLATATNTAANTLHAKVISNSYGGSEAAFSPTIASAYNHPGVVITASTGDHGWYDWDRINLAGSPFHQAAIPAALNTVVAVGGTSLYLNPDATRAGEQVWNNDGPYNVYGHGLGIAGASGGGCSKVINAKPWQSSVAGYGALGCAAKRRSTADIAAVADPFTGYDVRDTFGTTTPWQTIGGTSLAAPVIAAIWALAGGSGGVQYPSQSLYRHFSLDRSRPFYDVTVGGNAFCGSGTRAACIAFVGGNPNTLGFGVIDCSSNAAGSPVANNAQCNARPGFDGPTGVGTPKGVAGLKPRP